MRFEWDARKNLLNQRKHGIRFEDAVHVFDEPEEAIDIYDELHSVAEDRFITIGPIEGGLAVVVWTERGEDYVRVISARWATVRERALYRRAMEDRR